MLDKIPAPILRAVLALISRWPWLNQKINAFAINAAVNVARSRPHPLTTAHDYVSWVTLTDKRWSGRHLPPTDKPNVPSIEEVVKLFIRPEGGQKLSNRSSCLFPAFAQYLTDGFIRTRMPGDKEPQSVRLQNTSNHDIDMCPLYGRTAEQTNALRRKSQIKGERGRLKSQWIKGEEYAPFLLEDGIIKPEFEVLDHPLSLDSVIGTPKAEMIFAFGGDRTNAAPHVAMINTLFLREHNRLAGIVENDNPDWDDERIFQTARNATIVLFVKIVVEEYINHISPSIRFHVDPRIAWEADWNRPNWITTEFSLLYRWHSLVPDQFHWGGKDYPFFETLMNNRLLLDGGLLKAFEDISACRAGRLCAFNTPAQLKERELRAIQQGRLCRLPSYSDYREYVSLPRPQSFSDITQDPAALSLLKAIYQNVDDVEFYPGLFAEDHDTDSPLPQLMRTMVALDAFSQALTNPLLSKHVFKPETFTDNGWRVIHSTSSLADILVRNIPQQPSALRISMSFPAS